MRHSVCLALFLIALPATAGIYKWTDEHGKVHFSDVPPPTQETEKVNVTNPAGVKAPPESRLRSRTSDRRRSTVDADEGSDASLRETCLRVSSEQRKIEELSTRRDLSGDQREALAYRQEQNKIIAAQYKCGS